MIALNRQEAVEVITLLVGQLADRPVPNNHAGAAPSINIVEWGRVRYSLGFLLDKD